MTKENQKIIQAIIDKFGGTVQIDKIQEEAMELALALHQLKCPTKLNKEKRLNDVYKELADMKIMMAQADIIFGKDKIDSFVHSKLQDKKEKHLNIEKTETGPHADGDYSYLCGREYCKCSD
jgi:hypothetical protein